MDFKSTQSTEWRVAFKPAAELIEDGRSKCDFCRAVEVNDGLEWATFARSRGLVLAENELVKGGHDVLESSHVDILLRHTLVGGFFVFAHALGEMKTRAQRLSNQVDDVSWDRGREHEILAFNFFWIRQVLSDVVNLLLKSVVK